MARYAFKIGEAVRLAEEGTIRFPVPVRYAGRSATVVGRHRQGNTLVYEVAFPSNRRGNRVCPLPVTQSSLISLDE